MAKVEKSDAVRQLMLGCPELVRALNDTAVDDTPGKPVAGLEGVLSDRHLAAVEAEMAAVDLRPHYLLLIGRLMQLQEATTQSRPTDGGLAAAREALLIAIRHLSAFPSAQALFTPLIPLAYALADLQKTGARAAMLAVPGSNALPSERAELHALAAAWSKWLNLRGYSQADADTFVAEALTSGGYRMRGERGRPPSASTLEEWRRAACSPNSEGISTARFDDVLMKIRDDTTPSEMSLGIFGFLQEAFPYLLFIPGKAPSSSGK